MHRSSTLSFSVRALMVILIAGAFFVGLPVFAAPGIPRIMNVQGRLLNSSGAALGGAGTEYCFRFSFYDVVTTGSGTKLWPAGSPSPMTVLVRNGIYNAGIGDTSIGGDVLDFNFQDTDTTYLNVEVATKVGATCAPGDGAESFETLSPRQRVLASGYAINASMVGGFLAMQHASGNQVPVLSSGNLILGGVNPIISATTTNTLTLQGNSSGDLQFFSSANRITSAGNATFAGSVNATGVSTTNATTTNLSVGGGFTFGSATGVLKAIAGVVATALLDLANDVSGILGIANGGIGTSTAPAFGQLLVGNASGGYDLIATSSLGITSATWGNITGTIADQTDLQNALDAKLSLAAWYATSTDGLDEGIANLYYTDARVNSFVAASSTIAKLYAANAWTATQTFSSIIATNATSSVFYSGLLSSLNGVFGSVSATSSATFASTTAMGRFITGNIVATSTATSSFAGPLLMGNTTSSYLASIFGSTTAPTSATGTAILAVTNTNPTLSSGTNILRLNMRTPFGTTCTSGTTCPRFIEYFAGLGDNTDTGGRGVGSLRLSTAGTGITQTSGAADFAEYMILNSAASVGDLVSLNASGEYQRAVAGQSLIGVISDNPAFVGNANLEGEPNAYVVGFAGVIETTVSAANGAINAGDFIAASTTAGVGVKLMQSGYALGQALDSYSGPGTGTITVLVMPKYVDAAIALESYGGGGGGTSGYWSLSTSTGAVTLASTTYGLTLTSHATLASASTTNISATYASSTQGFFGSLSVGNLTGILRATAGSVTTTLINLASDVTGILGIANGGTGTSTAPAIGQVLVGNASGGYDLVATSSLGISSGASFSTTSALYFSSLGLAFSTTSNDAWLTQRNFFSTTSADAWKLSRDFFSTTSAAYFASIGLAFSTTSADYHLSQANLSSFSTTSASYFSSLGLAFSTTSAIHFIHSSSTIPKTYTSNTFTGTNSFLGHTTLVNASTTNITVSGTASTSDLVVSNGFIFGSTTGVLKSVAGVVSSALLDLANDVTGILGISNGGTGTSTAPNYGQVLLGNAAGGYDLVATSSLGITSGSGNVGAGTAGQVPYYAAGGSALTATSSLFLAPSGKVGIGSTTPWGMLSITTNGLSGPAFAVSSPTGSLFAVSEDAIEIGDAGGTGDANFQFGSDDNGWSTGFYAADKSFRIASSTNLATQVALSIEKGGRAAFFGGVKLSTVLNCTQALETDVDGNIICGTDVSGGGGGAGAWATTTDSLAVYPADPSDVILIGQTATTTSGNILEVGGNALFRRFVTAYETVTAPIFTATSTSATSTLPQLAASALSVGSSYVTSLTGAGMVITGGVLSTTLGTAIELASAEVAGILGISNGGTGTSTAPALGQVLIGNASGGYDLVATSTLGLSNASFSTTSASFFSSLGLAFSTTSSDHWMTQRNFYSTTSADAWKLANNFFSTTSAAYFSSIGLAFSTTSADAWEAEQTARTADDLTNDSIEALLDVAAMSENLGDLFSWNGTAWANISTSTLGVNLIDTAGILGGTRGGTGLSSIVQNQLLIGGAGNTWVQVATSSLGIDLADTTGTLDETRGGTGQASYATGDILYASGAGTLTRLAAGSPGTVLKISGGGVPVWGTDLTSGGGGGAGGGYFSTTTNEQAIHPTDTTKILLVGTNATSTVGSTFEVLGRSYFSDRVAIGTTSPGSLLSIGGVANLDGDLSTFYSDVALDATLTVGGTLQVSGLTTLTNASTTILSAVYASSTQGFFGTLSVGSLSGVLRATAGVVSTGLVNLATEVTGILGIANGGTGTSTAPTQGQVLVGNAAGGYDLIATSSLGIARWGGIAGNLADQTDVQLALDGKLSLASWYATTTDGLAQGAVNRYYNDSLVNTFLGASTTVPKTFAANTFTNANTFSGAVFLSGNTAANSLFASSLGSNAFGVGSTATSTIQGSVTGTSTIQGFVNVLGDNSTSTFTGGVSVKSLAIMGTATSTAENGINLDDGCFAIDGVCVGSDAVKTLSSPDSSITVTPDGSDVEVVLNLGHANTWTALQQFSSATSTVFESVMQLARTIQSTSTNPLALRTNLTSTEGLTIGSTSTPEMLAADTLNNRITLGNGGGSPVLFVLDTKNTPGDPTGLDGAEYYNSNIGEFRCYSGTAWRTCGGLAASSTGDVQFRNADGSFTATSNFNWSLASNGLSIRGQAGQTSDLLTIASSTGARMLSVGSDGILNMATTTDPSAPTSGLDIYAKQIAGRIVPKWMGPAGVDTPFQAAVWQNHLAYFTPGAAAGLWQGTVGTNLGTAAIVLPSTTNFFTNQRRSRFSSVVTTLNQQVGTRSEAMFFRGNAAGQGGFFFAARVGFDTWTANDRMFVGLAAGTTAVCTGNPTLLANTVGFSINSGSTTIVFINNDGSGNATETTIAGQPALATNNGYAFYVFAKPNDSVVYWQMDDVNTGTTIGSGEVSTNLPVNTTMLVAHACMSNGTNTAVNAAQIGINRIYVETDR